MWNEESRKSAQWHKKHRKWLWHCKLVQVLIEDPTLLVKSRHKYSRIRARLRENGLSVSYNTVVTMYRNLKLNRSQTVGTLQFLALKNLKPKPIDKGEDNNALS